LDEPRQGEIGNAQRVLLLIVEVVDLKLRWGRKKEREGEREGGVRCK
jgi:hypothetical protein